MYILSTLTFALAALAGISIAAPLTEEVADTSVHNVTAMAMDTEHLYACSDVGWKAPCDKLHHGHAICLSLNRGSVASRAKSWILPEGLDWTCRFFPTSTSSCIGEGSCYIYTTTPDLHCGSGPWGAYQCDKP